MIQRGLKVVVALFERVFHVKFLHLRKHGMQLQGLVRDGIVVE